MEKHSYRIKGLDSMVRATNVENLDSFLEDLRGVIISIHILQAVKAEIEVPENFEWVDDGKTETITLVTPDYHMETPPLQC